jgi:hypothetical protein
MKGFKQNTHENMTTQEKGLQRFDFTSSQIAALLLAYDTLKKPKPGPIPLNAQEASMRFGLKIENTHYQYSGTNPIRNGTEMVIVNDNPVTSIDTVDNPTSIVTIRTQELIDGLVRYKDTIQESGFKGILPNGSKIKIDDRTELIVDKGEEYTSPIAKMQLAIDEFTSNLDSTQRELIQSIEFFELIDLIQNCEDLNVDSEVVIGFGNDLGNSQKASKEQVQLSGSRLIDNCAELSMDPVADGGDGSEGSRKVRVRDIDSMIKYAAYRDKEAVNGTELSVRSAYLVLNPGALLKLLPTANKAEITKLLDSIGRNYASILQSTIKEVDENKSDRSSVVLSKELADLLALNAPQSFAKGATPVTKQTPSYFVTNPETSSLDEVNKTINIATIDTANLYFEKK